MKNFLFLFLLLASVISTAQDKTETKYEYLTIRVQFLERMSGPAYRVFLDIGNNGSHSLSGKVINEDDIVYIMAEEGKLEFTSDIDLLNYLGEHGWHVVKAWEIMVLSEKQFAYVMQREY